MMFLRLRPWQLGLAVLCAVCGGTQEQEIGIPAYEHRDSITGQILSCNKCPPGEYLKQHCTTHQQTQCAPCQENHYTQYWNYINQCQYCNMFCKDHQNVKHECNATHNRVCECRDGFYWHFEFCLKHSECPSGSGVKVKGTPYTNTVCEMCPLGFYSNHSSRTEHCQKHTDCEALGLMLSINGTSWHDNLCFPLQNHILKDGLSLYEEVMFQFLSQQDLKKQQKVLKFGSSLLGLKQAQHLFEENKALPFKKLILLYLQKWKSQQKFKCLRAKELVDHLITIRFSKIARRVEKKFIKNRYRNIPADSCNPSLVVQYTHRGRNGST